MILAPLAHFLAHSHRSGYQSSGGCGRPPSTTRGVVRRRAVVVHVAVAHEGGNLAFGSLPVPM